MSTGSSIVGATGNQDVDGLLGGVKWNDNNVLFNFPSSATYYPGNYGTVQAPDGTQVSFPTGFVAVSITFQNMVKKALGEFEAVTNLSFTEVADNAVSNISVARTTALGPETVLGFRGYGFFPGSSARAGDIWFDDSTAEVGNTAIIGRGTFTLVMHELGHAVGLKHGHEGGGPGGTAMTTEHDHNDYSIMSYRRYEGGPTNGTASETNGRPQSLMMYDILALQTMYGAKYATNGINTVYTFSPTTGQMFVNGVGGDIPGNGAVGANRIYRTMWDGGGNDTYDLSNYGTNLNVDLSPGGKSILSTGQLAIVDIATARTATGNVFNALLFNDDPRSLIENAIGGTGNDTIKGNQADNSLIGNAGNDILTGESGADTLQGGDNNDLLDGGTGVDQMWGGLGDDTYVFDNAGDVVTENASEGTDLVQTGLANYSLKANFENLTGTLGAGQSLAGNGLNNVITGVGGNDIIEGLGGSDILNGQGGDDVLIGSDGSDTINGGTGVDALIGLTGTNTMTGGAGDDVYYSYSATDVMVELAGAAEGNDVVVSDHSIGLSANVERVILLNGATSATGNGSDNLIFGLEVTNAGLTLDGGAGNDILYGSEQSDTLLGGSEMDTLLGFGGTNSMTGGAGDDTYFSYSAADTINENAGAGEGVDQVISTHDITLSANVENLTLRGLAATGIGNGSDNQLFGLESSNGLILQGLGGADVLIGSNQADLLEGGTGNDFLFGASGADAFQFKSASFGNDTVTDFVRTVTDGVNHDYVDLRGLGQSFGSLNIAYGTGATITIGADTIFLTGVTSGLQSSDFLF